MLSTPIYRLGVWGGPQRESLTVFYPLFYLVQVAMLALLGMSLGRGTLAGQVWAVVLLGLTAMFIFGVHGMLSGTASMDFGGRKAAATVTGALDGIQYVGSGLTGFGLGWVLKTYGWDGVAAHGHAPAHAIHAPIKG